MKELFYYSKPGQEFGPQQVLVLSIGENHIGCCVTDKNNAELFYLALSAGDNDGEISIAGFEKNHPVVNHSFQEVKLAFDYPQYILLPSFTLRAEDPRILFEPQYGKSLQTVVLTDDLPRGQLKISYAIPEEVYNWVKQKHPGAKCRHLVSAGITAMNAGSDGLLRVDFRSGDFSVLAGRQQKILLAQTYAYTTPGDVIFYLLKICRQFSLSQDDVQVSLSGLLDRESSLYDEMHQYFIHIDFREAGWGAAGGYPAHYFTSLNELAKCAS